MSATCASGWAPRWWAGSSRVTRRTYRLPQGRAAFLTRAASPNNIAAQFIPALTSVEDGVVESFEHGGVPYSAYPRFHGVMAEDRGQTVVSALLD